MTDTLAKVLAAYVPTRRSSLIALTRRLTVTPDAAAADTLSGGLGVDWFWTLGDSDVTDRLPAEPLNGAS